MNVPDITLKDLAYGVAVATYRSFSRAADACAVSQPALSRQIMALEASLGVQLFERTKRRVSLTQAGERFVVQAQRVLDEAEKLTRMLTPQTPLSGLFRLGVIASAGPYLLPHFIGPLKAEYPALRLRVQEGLTEGLIRDLKADKLDAVIAATTFEDTALDCLPLFFEPFVLMSARASGQHPAVKIRVSDVSPEDLLLLEDGHCLKDQTLDLCSLADANTLANFRATSLETLLHMTAGGLGNAVIPILAAPVRNKLKNQLTLAFFQEKGIGRTMALYYRKTYPLPDNLQHLRDIIQAHLPILVTPIHE